MRYLFFRIMTLSLLLFGVLGVNSLAHAWKLPADVALRLALGLLLPLLFGAALFVYKSYAGIKKPWVALCYWSLWASYTTLFFGNYLVVRSLEHFFLYSGVAFIALLACVIFASRADDPSKSRLPVLILCIAYSAQTVLLYSSV